MRRRAIIVFGLSCLLAACAHEGVESPAAMAWSLHSAEGEGVKLAYGQPASDNVVLMMTCQPRSGQVLVSLTAPAGETPAVIEISSKRQSTRLAGELVPGPANAMVEASAPATDPALQSFAKTGDISIADQTGSAKLPVGRVERLAVSDFFDRCAA